MSKKRNAGYRAAKANMAYLHREASFIVGCAALNKALDDFLAKKTAEWEEAFAVTKDLFPKGLGGVLDFSMNTMFGVKLMDPMSLATISSLDTGRIRRREVPPLFAPRDNGHRQSPEDLEKLEALILANKYVVPASNGDKWGTPLWVGDVELVNGRHPDAGEWGKLCFRTACQKPNAFFYNSGSYKHYCQKCADDIDRENMGGFKLHHLAMFDGQTEPA